MDIDLDGVGGDIMPVIPELKAIQPGTRTSGNRMKWDIFVCFGKQRNYFS